MTTPIINTMTKEEVLTVWIDALRSGDYVQGQEALTRITYDGKEFDCCLGVFCKLTGIPGDDGEWDGSNQEGLYRRYKFPYDESYTDIQFDGTGYYSWLTQSKREVLMGLNDENTSFKDIANVLERWRDKGMLFDSIYDAKVWLGHYDNVEA